MNLQERVYDVVEKQSLAVLGTSIKNKPHTTLVAFRADISGGEAFFVTSISSRKAKNIDENPFVSLFVDNRSNSVTDFRDALGITLKGKAVQIGEKYYEYFLEKHPHMEDFVKAPSTKIYKIELDSVEVVTEFQKVYELNLDE
jgi:uncharacterized protein YhbP (UPF0306 family)